MKREEFYFESYSKTNKLHAIKWVPSGTPLCIVHIVHGMAEHMGRYEEFARFLTTHNILVVGSDFPGHGLSEGENPIGFFYEKEPGKKLVEDLRLLKNEIRSAYPGIPYVLFGHSLGSFVVRNFVHSYGKEVDGAILHGTGMLSKVVLNVLATILWMLTRIFGAKHVSPLMNKLALGGYMKRVDNPKTESDWLCSDEESIRIFREDPLCGFSLTLNGFRGMEELVRGLYDKKRLATVEKDIPMYFIYGEDDPVGDYGKGVQKSCRAYRDAGLKRISVKSYPGKRHELLHEDNREEVMQDILNWIRKEIG